MIAKYILAALFMAACQAAPIAAPSAALDPGSEESVEGVVIENVLDCERDLSCFLKLSTQRGEITVEYAAPRGVSCPNVKAAEVGLLIRPGQRVHVFAQVISPSSLSTCPDEKFNLSVVARVHSDDGIDLQEVFRGAQNSFPADCRLGFHGSAAALG